jgi:hypothetical protein
VSLQIITTGEVNMKGTAAAIVIAIIYLAALFVLVRPGSQGPGLVNSVSNGLTSLIGQATGGGTWSQGKS